MGSVAPLANSNSKLCHRIKHNTASLRRSCSHWTWIQMLLCCRQYLCFFDVTGRKKHHPNQTTCQCSAFTAMDSTSDREVNVLKSLWSDVWLRRRTLNKTQERWKFWPLLSLPLSLSLYIICLSFSSQSVKADERPLESGSAPSFFLDWTFAWPLLHLACSAGFS